MRWAEIEEGTRCWKGYEKKGMKTMFGKRVPNCVKREDIDFLIKVLEELGSKAEKELSNLSLKNF